MDDLLHDVVVWLEGRDEAGCRSVAAEVREAMSQRSRQDPSQEALGEMAAALDTALGSPGAIGLTRSLRDVPGRLGWQVDPEMPKMFALLIGTGGVIHSDRFAFGAFMMAPELVYPLHSHAALETYVVLSGESSWWNSDAGYQPVHPGQVIVHQPFQHHAMRTTREPMLALWAWQGDISMDTYRYEPAGFDADGRPI